MSAVNLKSYVEPYENPNIPIIPFRRLIIRVLEFQLPIQEIMNAF